jgi:hypothetical protein
MQKITATLAIMLLTQCAYAATELYWDAPTERIDGTPISSSEIDQFEVRISCGNLSFDFITQATSFVVPQDIKGTCEAKVLVIDTDGLKSDYSDMIVINLRAIPRPPFNLRSDRKQEAPQ